MRKRALRASAPGGEEISRRTSGERGVVLMMVLWVMVFLGVVTAEFAKSMRTEISITRNYKEDIEAHALAGAGLAMAFAEILSDYDYNTLAPESGELLFLKQADEAAENPPAAKRTVNFGPGKFSFSIVDEERKININGASRATLIRLLSEVNVEMGTLRETIADSILDWLDPNSLHRVNGAEDSYYMSLPEPYHCKNGKFSTVDELLLVKGMTRDILYGVGEYTGIAPLITVIGTGKINMNTSSENVLSVAKGPVEAKKIVVFREQNDGIYDKNQKSSHFLVRSTGAVSSVRRTIQVYCKKTIKDNLPSLKILSWNENL